MIKIDFPQVDIPQDFIVGTNITEDVLNFYRQSCRLRAGIFALCLEGNVAVSINLTNYNLKKNDFISLLPGSIIQYREQKSNVRLSFIGFSNKFVSSVNLIKTTMDFFPVISNNPVFPLTDSIANLFSDYFSLLERASAEANENLDPEIIKSILTGVLYGVGNFYRVQNIEGRAENRSEEICKTLVQLIMKHYVSERQISFYASQLSISPQHLSSTVKKMTGKTVSEIIASIVIMDAKAQLKSTNQTIQEISYSLNFPNVSFFGKYFKRHVGMSPKEYRNS